MASPTHLNPEKSNPDPQTRILKPGSSNPDLDRQQHAVACKTQVDIRGQADIRNQVDIRSQVTTGIAVSTHNNARIRGACTWLWNLSCFPENGAVWQRVPPPLKSQVPPTQKSAHSFAPNASQSGLRDRDPIIDYIRTSIYDQYLGLMKSTIHLDHISHRITASGKHWSKRWNYRVFIVNTRPD